MSPVRTGDVATIGGQIKARQRLSFPLSRSRPGVDNIGLMIWFRK